MTNTDRLEQLAVRLHEAIRDVEPYDYEGSAEQALESLKADPIGIIEYLVGIVEDIA